jgi:hypothetical protein
VRGADGTGFVSWRRNWKKLAIKFKILNGRTRGSKSSYEGRQFYNF